MVERELPKLEVAGSKPVVRLSPATAVAATTMTGVPRPAPAVASLVLGLLAGFAATDAASGAVVSTARTEIAGFVDNNPKAPSSSPPRTRYVLSVAAGDGETNALVIERAPGAMIVRDAAAITPGAGCELLDATTARCATPASPGALVEQQVGSVSLGDGDDSFQDLSDSLLGERAEVDAGSGADVVVGAARAVGGPGNDRLVASVAEGGDGDDVISARRGDGGDGDDVLGAFTAPGTTKLSGGAGNDMLTGGDSGLGFDEDVDVLDGGEGDDVLRGGGGSDRLLPGPGADVIDGGPQADSVSFAYASAPVRADLAVAGPIDPTGEGDAMTGVEHAEGGAGDDELLGGADDSFLIGGPGRDRLSGRGGRDVLDGGLDDDVLLGAEGNDLIVGGAGADTLDGAGGNDELLAGTAIVDAPRHFLTTFEADASPDRVTGAAGADSLRVGAGDSADAGPGNDVLESVGRPAFLSCAAGRDVFDGEALAPRNCERASVLEDKLVPVNLRLRGRVLTLPIRGGDEARVSVVLLVAGRPLARARGTVHVAATRMLRLRLTPRRARLLRRARTMRLSFTDVSESPRKRDSALLPAVR